MILVSGSVGKTTTKDAIYHVLKETAHVQKSEKSFNSEIGVPLTILGLPNAFWSPLGWLTNLWRGYRVTTLPSYPDVLVLEVGSDHPGDISRLTAWLSPDIAVITRLPDVPVHVEFFDSPESLRKEDAMVVTTLPAGGVYIANADDEYALALTKETDKRMIRSLSYGFAKDATIRGVTPHVRYEMRGGIKRPVGMEFSVVWEGDSFSIFLDSVLGVASCTAALAALAVGIARGVSMVHMTAAFRELRTPPGRMRLIEGIQGSTIIDDTYNSSPAAMEVALHALKETVGNRRFAILGDMLELGDYSEDAHRTVGRLAATVVDELITVGRRARMIADAAVSAGFSPEHIHEFMHAEEAGEFAVRLLHSGDIILAKGSQGSGVNMIRLERAVKILMAHPEEAASALVRQEAEWRTQ